MISNPQIEQLQLQVDVARLDRDAAKPGGGAPLREAEARLAAALEALLEAQTAADLGKPTVPFAVPADLWAPPAPPVAGAHQPLPALLPAAAMTNLIVNGKGLAEASLPNLRKLLSAQNMRIGFDLFRACVMVEQTPGQWRRIHDHDLTDLRERIERTQRFAAVRKDMMRDAIDLVAHDHEFDSAIVWLNQQAWDNARRVDRFLHDYCGCPLDEYTIAVSRYIWSGLAARVLEPGCQLDMVIGLLSKEQGFYKSSAMLEMVPDPEFFTDGLDLSKDDDDFKRLIKGKLIAEIAEMVGVSKADVSHLKRTITRRFEEYVEKWQTIATRYARRCMLFATTNEENFLPRDETGQRRWLPVEVGHLLRDLIKRDRNHLWAEGAAIYRARIACGLPGVEFEEAERLAKGRHARHEQRDVWESAIALWLETPIGGPNSEILPAPCTRPLTVAEVLQGALLMNRDRMDKRAEMRVATVLRQLGYTKRQMRIDGQPRDRWVRA